MSAEYVEDRVRVIGGGLAGSEAALFLARHGIPVELYDLKPDHLGEAQSERNLYAELVCSNSLKSADPLSAPGLLKTEMRLLGSAVMWAADQTRLPSGQDLAVDRQEFSRLITERIASEKLIRTVSADVATIPDDGRITIVCTGPLTSPALSQHLAERMGAGMLAFYDAAAPLVFLSSIDQSKTFEGSRWNKGEGKYLNCPLTKDEYFAFVRELTGAKRATLHDFDHFEGCLPLEVMASRGPLTLRYGPLKPQGLNCPEGTYAVVQLRQDDAAGKLYGLVGFQTNLTYPEQKRVFSMIPALAQAKFARFGLMHRNTYVCAPAVLNRDLTLKCDPHILLGGQISGVEGYCESAATGLLAGIYAYMLLTKGQVDCIPLNTMLGSLVNYLVMSSPKRFAPMNATYGILVRDSIKDHARCAQESEEATREWQQRNL